MYIECVMDVISMCYGCDINVLWMCNQCECEWNFVLPVLGHLGLVLPWTIVPCTYVIASQLATLVFCPKITKNIQKPNGSLSIE